MTQLWRAKSAGIPQKFGKVLLVQIKLASSVAGILIWVLCCSDKYHNQKHPRAKGVGISSYTSGSNSLPLKNFRAGTWRQEPKQTRETCCLVASSQLSFSNLSYRALVHLPRDGTTHSGLGPHTSN